MTPAHDRFDRALGVGPTLVVPRFAARAFTDAAMFYEAVGDRPALLHDALPDDPGVRDLTLHALAVLLAGGTVEGYARATDERERVPADQFFRELREGRSRHNVVDHPVDATPLRGHLMPPPYLRANWLPPDRSDLGVYPLSFTISPAGNFTPVHIDAYGMQGWMLLLEGRKHWRFVPAEYARARLDDATGELPSNDPAVWNGVPRFDVIAARGDLVFIPPGWAHQVLTLEESLGVGGSVINEHRFDTTMTAWLTERSLGFSHELDVASLARVDTQRVARAIAAHVAWQRAQS